MVALRRTWRAKIAVVMVAWVTLAMPMVTLAKSTPQSDWNKQLADCKPLQRAFWKGQYDTATKGYTKLLKTTPNHVPAAVGLAEVYSLKGLYTQAEKTLDQVEEAGQNQSLWLVARSRLHQLHGRYPKALELAGKAFQRNPLDAEAILQLGELQEFLGQEKQALATYRAVRALIEKDLHDDTAASMVAVAKILDHTAVLTAQKASYQAQNTLDYFHRAYRNINKDYAPANMAAGMFLLNKHKPELAAKEFARAAKINANHPDVLAGQAMLYLGRWKFENCDKIIKKALRINPHHPLLHYIQASCYMQWRKFENVPALLKPNLKLNPNDLESLSLMAAAYLRLRQPEKAKTYIDRVKAINPKSLTLFQTIGRWLEAGRQYKQAETYLLQAAKLHPKRAEPLASLGVIYMQTGYEKKALAYLEKAHELDDFRQDVVNYLNVVKKLQNFAVRETEHFIIKVDKRNDLALLDVVADFAEEMYPEVCGDHQYEPREKTLIEIMPTQGDFSARISGRGWIPTVGACTGRVIAIAVPHQKRGQLGLHNWGEVLRHEFVHTLTLDLTNNRIPHWFTEACAVWQQKDKRAFRYIATLVNATKAKKLFPISELNWGFIRPKRPGDRTLAYAQSEWAMDYIIQAHGFDKINEMLRGFRDGKAQPEIFKAALNTTEAEFDKSFYRWACKTVKDWGYDPQATPDLSKVTKAAKAEPDNPEVQGDYALTLLKKGKTDEAKKVAEKLLAKHPDHSVALRVMANYYMKKGQHDKAVATAKKLEQVDPTTTTAPKILAVCHLRKKGSSYKDLAVAIRSLELLQQRQPLESFSYSQLANIYTKIGQPDKALPSLIYLHKHTMNNQKYARQIAEIYRTQRNYGQAFHYFREVTRINPYELSAHRGMADMLVRMKEYKRAVAAAKNVTLLEPRQAESWNYYARILYRAGKKLQQRPLLLEARDAAKKALEIDPKSPAKTALQYIEAVLETMK